MRKNSRFVLSIALVGVLFLAFQNCSDKGFQSLSSLTDQQASPFETSLKNKALEISIFKIDIHSNYHQPLC